jgi:hypothetical protein
LKAAAEAMQREMEKQGGQPQADDPNQQAKAGGQRDAQSPDGQQPRKGQQQTAQNQSNDGQQPQEAQSGSPQPGQGQRNGQPKDGQQPGGAQQPESSEQLAQNQPQEGQQSGQGGGQQGKGERNGQSQNSQGSQPGGEPADFRTAAQRGRGQRRPESANGGGGSGGGPEDDLARNRAGRGSRVAATDPLTGNGFTNWSDSLREAEEMIDETDLRNGIAAARERARLMRLEMKRDLKKPDWAVVQLEIVKPLVEVRNRLREELARRDSDKALVPVDRDPVPAQFSENVRRYYEQLGKDQ